MSGFYVDSDFVKYYIFEDLTPGEHVIEYSVKDDHGSIGKASIKVNVIPAGLPAPVVRITSVELDYSFQDGN